MMNGRDVVESPGGSRLGSVLSGGWRLVGHLGQGLVGHVFEAERGDERGAACVLRDELMADPELREDFVAAGMDAGRVRHADQVRVLAHGLTDDSHPFIVSELLEGETFAKLVRRRRGKLYPAEALRLVRDALDVVVAAHDSGIVHGELTPDRLFITDGGAVKVLGFGIASLRRRAAGVLGLPNVPGTLAYLAPEQLDGDAQTPAGDLYSLGAVLFTLLTAESTDAGDKAQHDKAHGASWLARFAPAAPPSLLKLVERALASAPDQRFEDARAMRTAVDHVLMLPALLHLKSLRDAAPRPSTPPPTSGVSREPPLSHRNTVPAPPDSVPRARSNSSRRPVARGSSSSSQRHGVVHVAERVALRAGWRGGLADTMPVVDPDWATPAPESAQRPARARDETDVDGLGEFFSQLERALEACARSGIDAPDTAREIAQLGERAEELLAGTHTAVYWNVTEKGFNAGGNSVWQPEGGLARVPAQLFADGVRLLALLPGLEHSELARLVEILTYDAAAATTGEDDLVTLLWQAELPHVMHHAVGPFVDEEARASFEQEKRETLALVRFDTSFQLEDCWQDAHGDTSPVQWRESLLLVLGRRRNEDGQTFVGGRAALRVDPAEREATAARLAAEEHVSAARFERVLRTAEDTRKDADDR